MLRAATLLAPSKGEIGPVIDAIWPATMLDGVLPANGTNLNLPGWAPGRSPALPTPANSSASTLSGTGTNKWGTGTGYRGRPAAVFAAGAAGFAGQQINWASLTPALDAANESDLTFSDDYAVRRCRARMIFEVAGTVGADVGIMWSAANVGDYSITAGAAGFGFVAVGANILFIRRAQPGLGGVISDVVGVMDVKWHEYEAIAFNATPSKNARVEAYIDGNLVGVFPFNGGLNGMPISPLHSNGLYGFGCYLSARQNNSQIAVAGVKYTVGPTLQSVGR